MIKKQFNLKKIILTIGISNWLRRTQITALQKCNSCNENYILRGPYRPYYCTQKLFYETFSWYDFIKFVNNLSSGRFLQTLQQKLQNKIFV